MRAPYRRDTLVINTCFAGRLVPLCRSIGAQIHTNRVDQVDACPGRSQRADECHRQNQTFHSGSGWRAKDQPTVDTLNHYRERHNGPCRVEPIAPPLNQGGGRDCRVGFNVKPENTVGKKGRMTGIRSNERRTPQTLKKNYCAWKGGGPRGRKRGSEGSEKGSEKGSKKGMEKGARKGGRRVGG